MKKSHPHTSEPDPKTKHEEKNLKSRRKDFLLSKEKQDFQLTFLRTQCKTEGNGNVP